MVEDIKRMLIKELIDSHKDGGLKTSYIKDECDDAYERLKERADFGEVIHKTKERDNKSEYWVLLSEVKKELKGLEDNPHDQ